MRLYFDIVTATWGDVDDLVIVDDPSLGDDDLFILGEMSDSELIEYGKTWGLRIEPNEVGPHWEHLDGTFCDSLRRSSEEAGGVWCFDHDRRVWQQA